MRTLLLLSLCAALCASCSGGNTARYDIEKWPDDAQRLSLTVLPASFDLGGSADTALAARPEVGGVAVDITASATDLKAFYFDLGYDAAQWHPVSVEQNLGADDATLELAVTSDAGMVHAGRVLSLPQTQDGISGELTLATVHFAPGACSAGRAASAAPDRDGSKPVLSIDAAGLLTWKYASIGDYDQNRSVTIADLTALAVHLDEATGTGTPFPYDTIASIVDGDSNGAITIADITPIGANLDNTVKEYRIYRSQSVADYPASNLEAPKIAELATVDYEAGVGTPTQVRLDFSYDAAADGGLDPLNIFWVRPVDTTGNAGSPSNQVSPPTPGNVAPVIDAFTTDATLPLANGADANLTVTASDGDGDPLAYTYSATAGTVDATGTDTTVFHAPTVLVTTNVTITVTVDDGQGHTPTRDLIVSVAPDPVSEVHIEFSPVAEGGSGTALDAYGLVGDSDYTFTAKDQLGNDITADTTFEYVNDDAGPFPQGMFTGNIFSTNIVGSSTFNVVGHYHNTLPDQVDSNPDLVGEEHHFTIVFVLP